MKPISPLERAWADWLVLNETERAEFDLRATWFARGRKSLTEPRAEKRSVGRPPKLSDKLRNQLTTNNAALNPETKQ